MLSPDYVTAVLVTKGDVDMAEIVDNLIFDRIIVWDNSRQAQPPEWWWSSKRRPILWCASSNEMTYGRALAAQLAETEICFSQDDDIIHTPENQLRILSEYKPHVMVGCMWPEWSAGAREQGIENGYDDLVFAGSGSVYDVSVPRAATLAYLEHYPADDFFRLWADTIIGVIAPTQQLDIRFDVLPCAEADNRMCNLPDAVALKTEAIRRARLVRDLAMVAA